MRLLDSRRLRGPNLMTDGGAAIAEVSLEEGESPAAAVAAWGGELARLCAAIRWDAGAAAARPFPGGVAFALPAPLDVLMAATEVNEWAIDSASEVLAGQAGLDELAEAERLEEEIAAQARPRLVALHAAARARGLPFLWDDELVTVGAGRRGQTFAMEDLPEASVVDWERVGAIPIAVVTGTNGKTTSARLLACMARESERRAGHTSSDGIVVAGELIEAGDWTGGEAARTLLRRTDIDLAVIETARGGILRRGLAFDRADVALLTNVTRDHLGEYGVLDIETMARTKAVVGRIVPPSGQVVLNADDPHLLALAPLFAAPIVLFALTPGPVAEHAARGGIAYTVVDGAFTRLDATGATRLAGVADAPLTFAGAAQHNVANCLGAAAAAWGLGIADSAVTRALCGFDAADNPGRGRVMALPNGARALLDFAHNPDGYRNLFALARALAPAGRLFLTMMIAGDRTEEDIAAIAAEIARARPATVFLFEADHLLRGRPAGEMPALITRALAAHSVAAVTAASEPAAVASALAAAAPGDLLLVAPNIDRPAVAALLGS